MNQEKIRQDEMDIVKALGIILMVAGHADAPFTKFVYLFHMALFFIAAGYFYKDSASDSISNGVSMIKSRLKALWAPYFIWNAIYTVCNNLFIELNIYTNNNDITKVLDGKYDGVTEYLSVGDMIQNIIRGLWLSGNTKMGGILVS